MDDESISFIIISRNEEKRIQACIESVIECSKEYKNSEIILVDSASTDRTVDIAKRYPIKIIQLKPSWPLSPAAGEYTGFLHSKGDYVCFIDGDMILNAEWLKEALPFLKKDDVAGVSGNIINIFEDGCSPLVVKRINRSCELLKFGEVSSLGGPAMFRRNILEDVGCYHPFLKAGEEAELSCRIRAKGYKLLRLSTPMVTHNVKSMSLSAYIKKYCWGYAKAVGSSIRFSLRTNKHVFWMRLPEIIQAMFFNLFLLYIIFSLFTLIKGYILFTITTIAGYFLLFILSVRRRKDIKDALLSILIVHIWALAVFIGFLKDLPDPQQYPRDPIIIK
jgi:glycosyltransferase involved in cell wall biosynthesis